MVILGLRLSGWIVRFAVMAGCLIASPTFAQSGWTPPPDLKVLQAPFRRPAEIPFPQTNAFTAERELLGRTLFFDPRLSGSGVLSCATCHNPSFGWGDGMALGRGEGLQQLGRRTPTIINAAWSTSLFWDGRADTLEAQASGPMESPKEMNQKLGELPAKLIKVPGYVALFQRAYPGEEIAVPTISKAIATFERTVASGKTPFDNWLDGDEAAIPPSAKRGFVTFVGKANCAACHSGWAFTDNKFHDIGLETRDPGRFAIASGEDRSMHAFKTPTLRDVARRAPYMHNGSQSDLRTVILHYANGFVFRPSLSPKVYPLKLDEGDVTDLIAFMQALSSPSRSFAAPTLPQ